MINKRLATSKKFASVDNDFAQLLYCMLLPHADRDGRIEGDPAIIKGLCFPRRDSVNRRKISDGLRRLSEACLIVWYEVESDHFIEICKFKENQEGLRYEREAKSQIPPPEHENPAVVGVTPAVDNKNPLNLREEKRSRREDKPPISPKGGRSSDFDRFYTAYPRKRNKDSAKTAFEKRYKDLPPIDELIAIVEKWSETDGWKRENGQFIPYPGTWLNKGGWQDEIPEPQPGQTVKPKRTEFEEVKF